MDGSIHDTIIELMVNFSMKRFSLPAVENEYVR
jgi:hypothetical protein